MAIKEDSKYGLLTPIKLVDVKITKNNKKLHYYKCTCDCSNTVIKTSRYLKENKNPNCGCIKKEKCIEWGKSNKLINGNAALNNLYNKYKSSANRRNYTFELNINQFEYITSKDCYYCGLLPEQDAYSNGSKTSNYIYNGIDRIDNNKGYILENCVPCCKTCNFAKRNLSQDKWKDWLNRIVNFNKILIK